MAKTSLRTLSKFRWTVNGAMIKPAVNARAATLTFKFAGKTKLPFSGTSKLCMNTGAPTQDEWERGRSWVLGGV